MSSARNRLLLATTVAAAATAGGTAALTRARVREQQRRPDPEARTLQAPRPADRTAEVTCSDGVRLHVEEVGPADAALTVVFVHGWTCTMETWVYQRRDLAAGDVRLVFYDQRGHGRSGRPDPEHTGIDQLGSDLAAVLHATRPAGRVVLVGHSMGGMTIMALADQRPELFAAGGPVAGVCLMSTSAGKLAQVTLGLPTAVALVGRRVLPGGYRAVARFGDRIEAHRRRSALTWMVTKYLSYGGDVPPSLVELMERMFAASPLAMTAQFGTALLNHDKLAALPALRDTPTLILVGETDVLTPVDHSREMARALPHGDLVVLSGAGHMVMLERPALTNLHLRTLFGRALQPGSDGRPGLPRPAAGRTAAG